LYPIARRETNINSDGSSQKGSIIQCALLPSIPSCPPMAAEKAG